MENLEKISTAAANLIIYIWFRCRKQKLLAHGFIGSSYTEFQNSEVVTIIGTTVSFLAGKLMNKLGITSDAAYYFAKIIIGLLAYSYPHHMAVSKRLYEVRTSYDNTYLMHCYHTFTYLYDAHGIMINTSTDYYQVIGG